MRTFALLLALPALCFAADAAAQGLSDGYAGEQAAPGVHVTLTFGGGGPVRFKALGLEPDAPAKPAEPAPPPTTSGLSSSTTWIIIGAVVVVAAAVAISNRRDDGGGSSNGY